MKFASMRMHIKKIWVLFLFFLMILPVFPTGAQEIEKTNDRIVQGQVLDVRTGSSLADAKVSIFDRNGNLATTLSGQNPYSTASDGKYLFHVNPGYYKVELEKAHFIRSILNSFDVSQEYFYTTNKETTLDLPMRELTIEQEQLMKDGEKVYETIAGDITASCELGPKIIEKTNYSDFYSSLHPLLQFQIKEQEEKINPDCINLEINGQEVHPTINPLVDGYDVKYEFDGPIDEGKYVQLSACDANAQARKATKNVTLLSPLERLFRSSPLSGAIVDRIRNFLDAINPTLTISGSSRPYFEAKPLPISLTQFPVKLPIPTPVVFAGAAFLIFALGTYFFLRPWLYPVVHPTGELFVVFDKLPNTLDPFSVDERQKELTANMYEPLVDLDTYFRPQPILAKTWGNISPTEWEFKLRTGVLFHDGKPMLIEDVLYSWDVAKASKVKDFAILIETIEKVEKRGDDSIHIFTKYPDPLFLTKLRYLPIVREVKQEQQSELIGTGPYVLVKTEDASLTFETFKNYWGQKGKHPIVHVHAIADKYDRVDELLNGHIDILGSVPVSRKNIEQIEKDHRFNILKVSGFETIYLIFRPKVASIFVDPKLRDALANVIDPEKFTGLDETGLKATRQYIASGIPGTILEAPKKKEPQDIRPYEIFIGENNISFTLSTTKDFEVLADFVRVTLEPLGVRMKIEILTVEEMRDKLKKGEVGAFIAGWHFDLGDPLAFFNNYAEGSVEEMKDGKTNITTIAELLHTASKEMDAEKRTKILEQVHEYMRKALVGVPLFETQTFFVKKKEIRWTPRLDGEIRFKEIF